MGVTADPPPRIGVSSCLLGERVRYDGGHKLDRTVVRELGPAVEWVPVCPEVELGLGTPRPPIRLERDGATLRLVEPESRRDLTAEMRSFARQRVRALARKGLCGYVLKSGSPSCGSEGVAVRDADGQPVEPEPGLFAQELMRQLPDLPVTDEESLADAGLRQRFLERAIAYGRSRRSDSG